MIVQGNALHLPFADGSVDCVVTSPPYLKQRRYGSDADNELGLEETAAEYVEKMVAVFRELRRVMKPDSSTAWLNIGDKANNSGGAGGDWGTKMKKAALAGGGPGKFRDAAYAEGTFLDVPGLVLAGLLADGWRLRLPIVWDKGREGPESMHYTRRPRWSHEMIYMLIPWERARRSSDLRPKFYPSQLAETGSVWHFPPGGQGPSHLAPFPDELARRCILPTTLPGDVVLDPFSGSGTVVRVAQQLGRVGLGVELYHGREQLRNHRTTPSTQETT